MDIENDVALPLVDLKSSQARLEAASERVVETQNRMEQQLQAILASKNRHQDPLMAQSLDASSPEGRETWMNLGRLLRTEGITPAMIKHNRDVLVKAMKRTLQEDISQSIPDSYQTYHTAVQSFSDLSHSSYSDRKVSSQKFQDQSLGAASMALLGSAPPRGTTFTDEFINRQGGIDGSLDRPENVEEGLQSLFSGMSEDKALDRLDEKFEDDMTSLY